VDKEFLRLWFRQNCDPYNDKVCMAPAHVSVQMAFICGRACPNYFTVPLCLEHVARVRADAIAQRTERSFVHSQHARCLCSLPINLCNMPLKAQPITGIKDDIYDAVMLISGVQLLISAHALASGTLKELGQGPLLMIPQPSMTELNLAALKCTM